MKPIIFLDIDGVLNVRLASRTVGPTPYRTGNVLVRPAGRVVHHRAISAGAVSLLNSLLSRSAAQLVVSSSWRLRGDVRPVLTSAGVRDVFHPDWRTDADGPDRGDEIGRWLTTHDKPKYVVLDDWSYGLGEHLDRAVLTDFKIGLQLHDCDDALAILRAHEPAHGGW